MALKHYRIAKELGPRSEEAKDEHKRVSKILTMPTLALQDIGEEIRIQQKHLSQLLRLRLVGISKAESMRIAVKTEQELSELIDSNRIHIASYYEEMGDIEKINGGTGAGQKNYETALKMVTSVMNADPEGENIMLHNMKADLYQKLGDNAAANEERALAEAAFRHMLEGPI